MRALADASSCKAANNRVNNIASNYSPEVETEKPFTRKRKENDLPGKVLCVCILMRPPLSSRSSTKLRGSKIGPLFVMFQ